MDLLRVEDQEMHTVKDKDKILERPWQLMYNTPFDIKALTPVHVLTEQTQADTKPFIFLLIKF